MRKWSTWLAVSCALGLALGANGCTTCGSNPSDEQEAGESMGQAADEELESDEQRNESGDFY
jgi:hypothetical protein